MGDAKMRNPFIGDKLTRLSGHAKRLLGYPDRMLYRSKGDGKPTTIFNANIYDSDAEKIWYGDLEIERDRQALAELSEAVGSIYILWEMDGRFLEKRPTIEYVRSRAIVVVEKGNISFSTEYAARVQALTERAAGKRDSTRRSATRSSRSATKKKGT